MCYMESEEACLMSSMVAAEEELLVAAMDPFILEEGEFSLHQQQQSGGVAADVDSGFLFEQDANNGFDSFQSPLGTLDELIRSGSVVPKVEDSTPTMATTTTFVPACDSVIVVPHCTAAAAASASPASSSSNTAGFSIFSDDATSSSSVLAPGHPAAVTPVVAAMGIHHYEAAPPPPSSKQEQCSISPTATSCSMASMRESLYRMAIWRPVPSPLDATLLAAKPKRRNVRISKDPQTVAARHRRERISTKIRVLQRLVPGGTKMDTASMLDEAIHYVKYLKSQVQAMELLEQSGSVDSARAALTASSGLCQLYNQQQQQQSVGNLGGLAAASSGPTGGSTFFWPPQQHFNPVLGYQQLGY